MLTKTSQGFNTQVKEKSLLICHSTLDLFQQPLQSLDKPSRGMMLKLWQLRFLIQTIVPRLNLDALKTQSICSMMQVDLTHKF